MKKKFVFIASVFFVIGIILMTEQTKSQIDPCWKMTCENFWDNQWGYYHNPDSVRYDSCKCTFDDYVISKCQFIYARKYFVFVTIDTANMFGKYIYKDTNTYTCDMIIEKFTDIKAKLKKIEQNFGNIKIFNMPIELINSSQYQVNKYFISFDFYVNLIEVQKELRELPSIWSADYRWKNCVYLSIPEVINSYQYKLSPMPLNGNTLYIQSQNSDNLEFKIKIYNILGDNVFQSELMSSSQTIKIDLSSLANGYYTILINNKSYPLIIER